MEQRFYIFIITALCTIYVYGEENMNSSYKDYATKQYSIIPPAPEVASLMKYIDVPVSHFTGIPQIEIPIYTISEGSLSIPISLSYKGGGLKQNELPGIISKGWNLNAGITISRTVYGLPDECNRRPMRGFLNLTTKDKEMRNEIMSRYIEYTPYLFNYEYFYTEDECADYIKGYVDFANDIFRIYGMGISGTFIYSAYNNVVLSTPSDVIFKTGNENFTGTLVFYDKVRNEYYFEENGIDSTKTLISAEGFLDTDSLKYRSAWHITKIKSIHGDEITFEYSKPIYRNDFIGISQFYVNYNTEYKYARIDRGQMSGNWHKYDERNLLAIRSKSTIVKFHYDSLQNILESISIHRNDILNTELWRYKLLRDDKGNLSSIIQIGTNSEQDLYGFTYEPITCTKNFAIDHWGYCNGESDNPSLLPDIGNKAFSYKKGNREPKTSYTKQGILTKIQYPMGGYTYFNWEQNDYSYVKGNLVVSKPIVTETKSMQILKGKSYNQRLVAFAYNMNSADKIRLNLATYFGSLMNSLSGLATVQFLEEYNRTLHDSSYPCVKIIHVKQNGEEVEKTYYLDSGCEVDSIKTFEIQITGNYRIELCNPLNFDGVDENTINGYFGTGAESQQGDYGYIPVTVIKRNTSESSSIKPWGGLRIASIISVTEQGLRITKEYIYKPDLDSKYSSGVIYSEPYYESSGYTYLQSGDSIYYTQFTGINSDGLYASTLGEVGIEYSNVIERFNGEYRGDIEYSYCSTSDISDKEDCLFAGFVPRYFKTLTSNAHHRGILKEKKYSGFMGLEETKEVYKRMNYSYSILEDVDVPTFSGPLYTIMDFYLSVEEDSITGKRIDKDYTINKYKLIPYNKRVKSESVWEKDFYTGAESEQVVEYTYYGEENGYSDKPWNSFVKSKSYVNSRGQDVTTYYTYYKVGNVPLDLKELEIMVVDDIVVSARQNVYGTNHKLTKTYTGCVGMQFSSNFNLPDNILDDASYPAIDKEEYSYMYDSQGNIVQISYNGKVLASYLWGYKGKHPIVEAVGVSYAELFDVAKDYNYADGLYIDDMNLFLDSFKADNRFEGKEIKTYTYHWLLGMATSTDSRGVTNTYLLDDFGRLSGVKDTNGYYISKYDYNYKGF